MERARKVGGILKVKEMYEEKNEVNLVTEKNKEKNQIVTK